MNKNLIITISVLIGIGVGVTASFVFSPPFGMLSLGQMHHKVLEYRDMGIEKSKQKGSYNCCYDPGCTMCFMEANRWNNQKAGTCACADLIAQGKAPCPQCERALQENKENNSCKTNTKCDS